MNNYIKEIIERISEAQGETPKHRRQIYRNWLPKGAALIKRADGGLRVAVKARGRTGAAARFHLQQHLRNIR